MYHTYVNTDYRKAAVVISAVLVATLLLLQMAVVPAYAHADGHRLETPGKCVDFQQDEDGEALHNAAGDVLHNTIHIGQAGDAFDNSRNPVEGFKNSCP